MEKIFSNKPLSLIKDPGLYLFNMYELTQPERGTIHFDLIGKTFNEPPFFDMILWNLLHNTVIHKHVLLGKTERQNSSADPEWYVTAVSKLEIHTEQVFEGSQVNIEKEKENPLAHLEGPGYYNIRVFILNSMVNPDYKDKVTKDLFIYVYDDEPFFDLKAWDKGSTATFDRYRFENEFTSALDTIDSNANAGLRKMVVNKLKPIEIARS